MCISSIFIQVVVIFLFDYHSSLLTRLHPFLLSYLMVTKLIFQLIESVTVLVNF